MADELNPIRVKPVYLMQEENVSDLEKRAVVDGVSELIKLADVSLPVRDFGVWREKGYKNEDGSLKEYQSVDWYIAQGKLDSKREHQLHASYMMLKMDFEPWRMKEDHYDVMVLTSDIYVRGTNFVIGIARPHTGTILSTDKFQCLEDQMKYECIKTETMHELGHVFGMVPDERKEDVEYSLGKHCSNVCIMRQGITLPTDWINITADRLKGKALCDRCSDDLKNFFRF